MGECDKFQHKILNMAYNFKYLDILERKCDLNWTPILLTTFPLPFPWIRFFLWIFIVRWWGKGSSPWMKQLLPWMPLSSMILLVQWRGLLRSWCSGSCFLLWHTFPSLHRDCHEHIHGEPCKVLVWWSETARNIFNFFGNDLITLASAGIS